MPFTPSFTRAQTNRQMARARLMIGGALIVIFTIAAVLGVSQLKVVRDFFSQASGEPANIVIDTQAGLGPMPRPWRNLAQGGEGFNWRLQPISKPIQALHPQYIRLDHIYDFYDIVKGTPGNLEFDFSKFDLVLKDITAAGAKPYIALSYMPPVIAEGDIVSKPKRWADWQLVVQRTIEHVSGTLAIEDTYYEVWNEPDLFGGWKYYGDKSYLDLYSYAAYGANAAAKNPRVKDFKFGGPAITALYKNWFDALAKHAVKNNLRLDFFSWHRYTTNLDQYAKDMGEVRTWVADYPQLEPTLQFHITEWGHDSNNHPGYDTRFGAAHTVAGAISMVGVIEKAFVFEIQDGKDPAGKDKWGRWGLFTYGDNGVAKPRYQGLRMLDRLSDQRIQLTGNGSWVRALAAKNLDNDNVEVVMANYDAAGRNSENVPVTFENITPGSYVVKKEYLSGNRQQTKVATDAATLRVNVAIGANDVVWVELEQEPGI